MKKTELFGAVLLAAVAWSTPVIASAQNALEIYCNVAVSANNATPAGIYKFTPDADLILEPVKVDENIVGVNGAVYADGRYEIVCRMDHYTYDTETWEQIHSCKLGYPAFMEMAATAVTYDTFTGKAYGCYLTTSQTRRFAAVDYSTHSITELRDLGSEDHAKCMFVDGNGMLYAIMDNGDLVTVDKTDGTTAVIGNIDFKTSGYTGAVYNPESGTVYWTATVNGTPGLYELDLSDASTTLVGEFPNGEELTGLYLVSQATGSDGIPAAVQDMSINFPGGTLEGTLSFSAPTTDTDGNKLAGNLTYSVKVDEVEVATGSSLPGADVTTDKIAVAESGEHLFAVTFANTSGSSKPAYKRAYIGFDKPEAPTEVKLVADGLKLAVSWKAPTKGLNDAWFDAQNIKYNVIRYPGGVNVAAGISETEFSETLENASIGNYYYGVIACNGSENSAEALSGKVKLGTYILPPYSQDFRSEDALDFYTIIDANGDGVTWDLNSWSPIAEYYSASTEFDADDWMVTPPVSLSKNNIYCISLVAMGSESDFYDQNIKVMMGSGKTAEKLDTELVERTTVGSKPQTLKAIFTVEEDGIYYFGFHTSTPAHNGWVNMTDLSIMSVGTLDGPDVVKNLVVEPGEKGALEATITFTAPTADAKGNPLASIDKIELTRDGELIREWNSAVPGADLSHNDKALSTGLHSYEVTAYNESGAGYPAVTKGYIGVDVPASVENLTLAVADGKATLSWVPAAKGMNGGYVDTSSLKYYVQRSDGAYVASGIDGTSITDIPEKTEHQYELAYAVAAVSAEGSSPLAISNAILFGDNYVLPFIESFNNGYTNYYWGLNNLRGGMFMLSNNFSVDNDGGSIAYHGSGTDSESEVTSGRIDISTASAPVLSFYAPLNNGEVTLSVSVITPDNQIHEVKEFKFNISGAYNPVSLGLAAYKNTDYVQIVLNAKSTIPGSSLFIDAITLDEDSGVGNVVNDMNLAVTVNSPEVVIETAAGVNVAIYSASGVEVARFTATGHDTTTLGRGLYVVKAGTETRKFVVK